MQPGHRVLTYFASFGVSAFLSSSGGNILPRVTLNTASSVDSAAPEIFGRGVFSTGAWDFFVTFSPDGRIAYFCRANGNFRYYTILETHQTASGWSKPTMASFSGRWSDADPHISPDGSKLFFISNRPYDGSDKERADYDIWYVERVGSGWSDAKHIGAPVSRDSTIEWSPSVAANGNLYFGSIREGGKGGNDIYVARWERDHYAEPENLGDSINLRSGEVEPWIAPDESYLIFSGQGRPDGLGGLDLYMSSRVNGVWQKAIHLGNGVNSSGGDYNQSVSPDGKWLYWSSTRSVLDKSPAKRMTYDELERQLASPGNGLGDIYRIPMSAIRK
jgi:Tol biopolymer transport system component